MIRLALVGCGVHSEVAHAAPLARYAASHPGEVELAAACDLEVAKAREFQRKYGFARAYDDMQKMLAAEKPDGVVCVVPVELIARVNPVLLRAGVPCTVEKPPGASREEVRGLAELARTTGTPHLVSANRRFSPLLLRAVEWARAQGPLHYVRGTMIRHARREPSFIWGTAFHAVDALRFVAGEVRDFRLGVSQKPGLSARWYDIAFEFAGGASGRLEILPTAGVAEESYELFGEGYRARLVAPVRQGMFQPGTSLQCWRENRLELSAVSPPDEPVDVVGGPYGEVEEFVAALREKRSPRPTLDDVLPSAELCFALAEAAGVRPDGDMDRKPSASGT